MTKDELLQYLTTNKKYGNLKLMLGKSNPALLSQIQNSWPFDREPKSFMEVLYQYFFPTSDICSHGNQMKFEYFRTGYVCERSCPCTREKYEQTMLKRHGVKSPMQSIKLRDKAKSTWREKYGTDKLSEINKEHRAKTCLEKYDAPTPFESDAVLQKTRQTLKERLGVSTPFESADIQNKAKSSVKEKYGVDNILQLPQNKQKSKAAIKEKYGCNSSFAAAEVKQKIKDTFGEKYGCHPSQVHIDSDKLAEFHNDELFKSRYESASNVLELMQYYGVSRSSIHHRANDLGLDAKHNADSAEEIELYNFVKSVDDSAYRNDRKIIAPKELDIVVPNKKIAIEYDGIYYHSDVYSDHDSKYHLNKTETALLAGYQLIHVFSDEWLLKREIVESRIKSILGKSDNKIYARKTNVCMVETSAARKFLDKHHIQGYCPAPVQIGLHDGNELVALMTFGKPRFSKDAEYELIRYCGKININVVGGASKLFRHFIARYSPTSIISYADRRWSVGNLYSVLGFEHMHDSGPNYFYVKNGRRESRNKYQKHKLKKVLEQFDPSLSEYENMNQNGYHRIYDCGNSVWKWSKT